VSQVQILSPRPSKFKQLAHLALLMRPLCHSKRTEFVTEFVTDFEMAGPLRTLTHITLNTLRPDNSPSSPIVAIAAVGLRAAPIMEGLTQN
jgi:hypothetical protein